MRSLLLVSNSTTVSHEVHLDDDKLMHPECAQFTDVTKKSEAGRMLQLLEKQDKEAYFLKHCDVKEKFKDAASSLQNHQVHPHVLVSYTVA